MYACPHCQKQSFSIWRKWWASPFFPAKCSHCDGLSWVPAGKDSGIGLAFFFMLITVAVVAGSLESVWIGVLGTAAASGAYVWFWHRVKLLARTREEVSTHRGILAFFFALSTLQ